MRLNFRRRKRAEAEDAIADAQHGLEGRLHRLAQLFAHPAGTHRRADQLSTDAEEHRARARRLRRR